MGGRKNKKADGSEQVDISSTDSKEEEKKESKKAVDIGLDISTAVIGVCILEHDTGDLIHLSHIKLNSKKFKTFWEKADFALENLNQLELNFSKYSFKRIFVEENAKRFTPGFSSADTILTLAKFNGIISYLARNALGAEPYDVNVMSARKALGIKIGYKDKTLTTKEKTFIQVRSMLNNNSIWPQHLAKTGKSKGQIVYDVCCRDMSDSYVIARGGQLIHAKI